jgi:hypothetical protein
VAGVPAGPRRAAAIPEVIELVDNRLSGNGRDLSCGELGGG